jgi:hypothetical protein
VIGIIAIVGIYIPFNQTTTTVVKTKMNDLPNQLKQTVNEQPEILQNKIEEQTQFVQAKKVMPSKSFLPVAEKNNNKQVNISESLIAETTKHIDAQETITVNTSNSTVSNEPHVINNESNNHASKLIPVNTLADETASLNYAKPAVYKELDTEDERKSLFVGSVEINKDKLRGFLRKASSLFKGKNKNEEEKTEISNSHTLE